jgi:ubiquinone/menaquinone biosynthesis C-methylase UbiE
MWLLLVPLLTNTKTLCQPDLVKSRVDLSGTAFSDVDRIGNTDSFISYLDEAKDKFAGAKSTSCELLRLQPGEKVLDVGCGLGDDLLEMAELVGTHGFAVGVDKSESLIAEARHRARSRGLIAQFQIADAEQLPWDCNHFDACRADRLLQHVRSPKLVLDEMLRVSKPGGRIAITDRDWGMVALDSSDDRTTRLILEEAASRIRNPWIGRRLYGFFVSAGLEQISVQTYCINTRSFETADLLLDLRSVALHTVEAGHVSHEAKEAWLDDLSIRNQQGSFLATLTLFVVFGVKPRIPKDLSENPNLAR